MTDRQAVALRSNRLLSLLSAGEVAVEGLIPWSSNATLLVTVRDRQHSTLAIYKPRRGETPLWDFPRGTLCRREVAAYRLSEALGWGFVPPTVLRTGPHGLGSLQVFIHAREDAHYFTIRQDARYAAVLRQLAAFDVIANNADRKSGHCLLDEEGSLWAIDNALTFHAEPKLRTIIWDFVDEDLPSEVLVGLEQLRRVLGEDSGANCELGQLLSQAELAALRRRLEDLLRLGRFPQPGPGRAVPWPLI